QLLGGRPSGDDSQRAPREPMQRPQQDDSFDDDIPF
ncbi:single-stranded DNA-binding protein, partial [Pseudomonas aeruginosa]|nr:single-stranded DNA-binding protein [Pseudomonas aeruginosa]